VPLRSNLGHEEECEYEDREKDNIGDEVEVDENWDKSGT